MALEEHFSITESWIVMIPPKLFLMKDSFDEKRLPFMWVIEPEVCRHKPFPVNVLFSSMLRVDPVTKIIEPGNLLSG